MRCLHPLPAIFVLASFAASLHASSFSAIYAFGDSLSDAGNDYIATGGLIPGTPYVNGHFSNGQVWVQDLSASLGLGSLTPSLAGGNDFAYGGAYSGNSPVHTSSGITAATDLTGPTGQIAQFEFEHPTANPTALYTIWIGSNDMLATLASNPTQTQAIADISAVNANIESAIDSLAGEGAKNFLVLTVPDLGKTPGVTSQGAAASAAGSALAGEFDTSLYATLHYTNLELGGALNISVLDTYSLVDGIIANGPAYGFSNVTSPCVTGAIEYVGGTACSNTVAGQDQYLFWDQLHPTAAGHSLIAGAALNTLSPEPAPYLLLGVGLVGIYLRRRHHS